VSWIAGYPWSNHLNRWIEETLTNDTIVQWMRAESGDLMARRPDTERRGCCCITGLESARSIGAEGFSVALIARNRQRLDSGMEALRHKGITASAFAAVPP
jgi:hypothetical protein